jgi:hypothetical protein
VAPLTPTESAPSFRICATGCKAFSGQRERAAGHFLVHGNPFALSEKKDSIDRVRIIIVIRRNARSVGSAPRLRLDHFIKQAPFLDIAREDPSLTYVLVADGRGKVLPLRTFGIRWRIDRIGRDVARTTRNTYPIRADELVVVVVFRVVHKALAVPFLASGFVEIRIRKEAEPKDACGLSIDLLVDALWLRLGLFIEPETVFVSL